MEHAWRAEGLRSAIEHLDQRRTCAIVATRNDASVLMVNIAREATALHRRTILIGDARFSSVIPNLAGTGHITHFEVPTPVATASEIVDILTRATHSSDPAPEPALVALDALSVLGRDADSNQVLDLQRAIDSVAGPLGASVVSIYDQTSFAASTLTDAALCSPLVIYHETLCENVRYVPPDALLSNERETLTVQRLLRTLYDLERNRRIAEERDEQYRMLVEDSPDAVFVHSDGAVVYANRAAAEMVHASLSEILGTSVMAWVHPDSLETVGGRITMMLEHKISAPRMVERFMTLDGIPFYAEVVASPIMFEGKPSIQVIMRDQTERHAVEEELQFTSFLLDHVVDGIIVRDPTNLCVLYVNEAMCALGRMTREQFFSAHAVDWVIPEERDAVRRYVESMLRLGSGSMETIADTRSGPKPVEIRSSLITYQGRAALLSLTRDITERREAEATIEQMALHDPLTGLANHALLNDRLEHAIARARRAREPLALLFLDVDHFKTINDAAGHGVGDMVLQGVAARLRGTVRADDTVARLGGDEFTLVLPDIGTTEHATRIAQKILEELRPPFAVGEQLIHVTASLGIAIHYGDEVSAKELLCNADLAMYRAKEDGRNNYRVFDSSMDSCAVERFTLRNDLRGAAERGEISLHFQPIVRLPDRVILGAEALCRWSHPTRGQIPPMTFIPLAEEMGMMGDLGAWVLREACAEAGRWADAGHTLRMAVNLSPRQLDDHGFIDIVHEALADSGLAPHLLELEITETAAMRDAPRLTGVFRELRALGVRIAIDDFGTGYCSLDYLKQFPVDTLKVDRTFVKDLCDNANSLAIASTIVSLGGALNLDVVAEGVETEHQFNALHSVECPHAQGFLFSHGVPASDFVRLLHDGLDTPAAESMFAGR